MRGLTLIGLPGSGKSTLARVLSKSLGLEKLDSDDWIAEKYSLSLKEIAKNKGQDFLVQEEEACLKEHSLCGMVVATSGSVIYTKTQEKLKQETLVVYLESDLDDILHFLASDRSPHREIIGEGTLEEILSARLALYKEWSEVSLAREDKDIATLAQEIKDLYKKRGSSSKKG